MTTPLPSAKALAGSKEERGQVSGALEAKITAPPSSSTTTTSRLQATVRPPRPPVAFRLKREKRPDVSIEASHRAHHYSPEEQKKLASFQSISYLPLHTKIYREWLRSNWVNSVWEHWVMMGVIGISTGLLGAFIKNCIQYFTKLRFLHVKDLMAKDQFGLCWLYVTSISCMLAFFAAAIIVYLEPNAAGSGVPEIIAYLNGVSIPRVFGLKTLLTKCASVAAAVASGLYVGNEGPMIHIGAAVGKVQSQGTQLSNGRYAVLFKRFRNMYDRRNFISAGAAAGVASAFGAPVGALLFVLEEISSYWSHKLAWQTFFCCMLSTLTTEMILNSFEAFKFKGHFGSFTNTGSYVFYVDVAMKSQLKMFLPTVILGILGGLVGVLFTWLNLKISKWRNRKIARIPWRRVAEVVVLAFITTTLAVCLPAAFKCLPVNCKEFPHTQGCTSRLASSGVEEVEALNRYNCPKGYFNPAATLMFSPGDKTIEHLFSRATHFELDYGPVITLLILYFLLSVWSTGMCQASGLMVPSLLIGAALGRLFGLCLTDFARATGVVGSPDTDWIDPGVFALIGSAAFFAGVTRLTMSLVVIIMEMTNETHFLLPIMTAVIAAKLTADSIMDSLYHNLMQLKCLPYLSDELHAHACLELHSVKEVMSSPAVTLPLFGSVQEMAQILMSSAHSAFPVVEPGANGHVFKGVILRNHVTCILAKEELYVQMRPGEEDARSNRGMSFALDDTNRTKYGVLGPEEMVNLDDRLPKYQLSATDTGDRDAMMKRLGSSEFAYKFVNLSPYVDQSSYSIPETFSLERGYQCFRTMGLRHITVVDKFNVPVGVLSRKDLLSINVDAKIWKKPQDVVDRKRAVTLELVEKSRSNSLTLNPIVVSPSGGGSPASPAGTTGSRD